MSDYKKTAKFRFKCRLCGEFEDNPCTSVRNAIPHLHALVANGEIPESKVGIPPSTTTYHQCRNGDYGIQDLLGFIVVVDD